MVSPRPNAADDSQASGVEREEAVLESNSDFLDDLLGDSSPAKKPDDHKMRPHADHGARLVPSHEEITDALADAVIEEVLNEEILEASDEEPQIIPVSDLSDDSEAADEVLQELSESFQGNDVNEVTTSEVGVLHVAEEESLNQLDARLMIQSGESQDLMSDDSELAEEAVRDILDTPDMDTEIDKGADHFPDEEVKPCQ